MSETQLGYKQLVKEVLNKEYDLNLREDIQTENGVYDLIDINKEFIVDIQDSEFGIKQFIHTESFIEKVKDQFKHPKIFIAFNVLLDDKGVNYIQNLDAKYDLTRFPIFVSDIRGILSQAMSYKMDFTPYLESLIQNNSIIGPTLLEEYGDYISSFKKNDGSTSQDTRKKSVKGLDDDPNMRRAPLKRKTKFDSSAPPTISKELMSYNYHFAQVAWDDNDEDLNKFVKNNIWENKNGFSKYANLVQKEDILLGTVSVPDNSSKEKKYRVEAIGYVYQNEENSRNLGVTWRKIASPVFKTEEIAHNAHLSLGEVTKSNVIPILQGITRTIQPAIEDIIAELKKRADSLPQKQNLNNPENLKAEDNPTQGQKTESEEEEIVVEDTYENITRLAGIQSDSDDGDDYLDIENDVMAFARVMCAENFSPPLAIGLLGKWGAGKSFFMRKLQEKVELLSSNDNQNIYCKGIAEVHFNAWSYMDANLWAGIVTKIFERLNLYIKDEQISDNEKKEIKAAIAKKLSITSETIESLEKEKKDLGTKIKTLNRDKKNLTTKIDNNIAAIRKSTLKDILKEINFSFNVDEKITDALQNNMSYVKSREQLKSIVPEAYWNNPVAIYQQLRSAKTTIKQLFKKENWLWIFLIALIIITVPLGVSKLVETLEIQNFEIPNGLWYVLSSLSALTAGISRSYQKLSPLVASFWKIKEDYDEKKATYEQQKASAIFEFEQKEKALTLEIEDSRVKIAQIDLEIEQAEEHKKGLEHRISKTLSTETLYNFIEKKALSNDYKQYLGIVSIIRKDFEILSELFADSKEERNQPLTKKEAEKKQEIVSFRKRFKKPLERIILYVDDLDRCSEERVVQVLEAVNLLMAFPLFIVVVGVDPRWVKIALEAKYQKQFTLKTEEEGLRISPSNYLEKIFQIPFRLKSAEDKTVKSMLKSLAEKKISLPTEEEEAETPDSLENGAMGNTSSDNSTGEGQEVDTGNENGDANQSEGEAGDAQGDVSSDENNNGDYTGVAESDQEAPKNEKEVIESLEFSPKEIELIQEMSCVLGSNPRAIKRFVNIYRIMKAHDIFTYNPNTQDQEILADLFLIALPLGTYRSLVPSFLSFLNAPVNSKINTYLNKSVGKNASDELKKEDEVRKALLKELNSKGKVILEIKKNHFNDLHTEFIKRFYFN